MRFLILVSFLCLSACSWFNWHKPAQSPDPTEIIVTGCPAGSIVFLDGAAVGQAATVNNQTRVLTVAAGVHKLEIQLNGKFVYREDTSVEPGARRVVMVKSGYIPGQ